MMDIAPQASNNTMGDKIELSFLQTDNISTPKFQKIAYLIELISVIQPTDIPG
jgi:hypothetical protein